jgi:hypothetical protein
MATTNYSAAVPPEQRTVADIFAEHRHHHFTFISPGGNWGDHLIWAGAEHLGRLLGLRFRQIPLEAFIAEGAPPDSILYIHGGGGYNPYASGRALQALLTAIHSQAHLVIQGPQTVDTSETYLELFRLALPQERPRPSVVFFVREDSSFNALRRIRPDWLQVFRDHDTALHLDRGAFLSLAGCPDMSRYYLNAMRHDNEAPANGVVATARRGVTLDPAHYASSFGHWLRLHAHATAIHTNRTHSAVAGAILGKPTWLSAGAYHKNRSIWEYSLRDRGVMWSDPSPEALTHEPRSLADVLIPRKVRESWKVRRLVNYLHGVPAR